jgi:hypothetical protein
VEGTGQTTPVVTNTSTPTPPPADTTVRTGGLEFTIAGIVIVGLAIWYYYYSVHDPKKSLKMAEKKLKKS